MLIRLKQRKKIKPRTKFNHNSLFDLSCSHPRVISFPFSEWARRGRGEVMKTRLLFANMSPAFLSTLNCAFKNTWILKFKSQLMFVFLAAVNHLSGPLRNQKFTSMGSKLICDRWILIRFVCFCVSRFIARDRNYDWPQQKDENLIVKAAFEMQNSCVFEKPSKLTFLNCTLFFLLC